MDKPLVQRILELEEKVKKLEKEIPVLQKKNKEIRDFVGMNNSIKEKKHGNSKIARRN